MRATCLHASRATPKCWQTNKRVGGAGQREEKTTQSEREKNKLLTMGAESNWCFRKQAEFRSELCSIRASGSLFCRKSGAQRLGAQGSVCLEVAKCFRSRTISREATRLAGRFCSRLPASRPTERRNCKPANPTHSLSAFLLACLLASLEPMIALIVNSKSTHSHQCKLLVPLPRVLLAPNQVRICSLTHSLDSASLAVDVSAVQRFAIGLGRNFCKPEERRAN